MVTPEQQGGKKNADADDDWNEQYVELGRVSLEKDVVPETHDANN